jgi:hypothetical protein
MGNMVFVGKNGVKMIEIQVVELAKNFRLWQTDIVNRDQKTLTERVLSKMMGS